MWPVACDLQLFSVQQSPAAEGLTLKGENMHGGGMAGGLSRESTAHRPAARLVSLEGVRQKG